jgi:DNA adenine methylase
VLSLQGMVVISGYASDLYETRLAGWRRVEKAAQADRGSPRTEVLWINPAASKQLATCQRPGETS